MNKLVSMRRIRQLEREWMKAFRTGKPISVLLAITAELNKADAALATQLDLTRNTRDNTRVTGR